MLNEKDYTDLIDEEYAFPHPFHFLWSHISKLTESPKYSELSSFENRRDIFLSTLKRLLDEKKVTVGVNEKILSRETKDIIEMFERKFPKEEGEMDNGIWFLNYPGKCPGGAVWIVDNDLTPLYCTPTGEGKYYYWT